MKIPVIKMFRSPIPNAEKSMLENSNSEQLLGIFKSFLKTGTTKVSCRLLSDAWGLLFSDKFLSAEELIDDMKNGKHGLGEDMERMLREFIKVDCESGGAFVQDVIKNGGKIDRAALIMIADLEILSRVELDGRNTIQILIEACDKGVRPALIERAGKRLLSNIYDNRALPVFFSIFGLTDLCIYDLNAIAKVFSKEDLRMVMSRNRTGKNGLEVFNAASTRLKSHPPGERNKFFVSHAIKTTNTEGDLRKQVNSHNPHESAHRQAGNIEQKSELDEDNTTDASRRYESLMPKSSDDISKMIKKTHSSK